MTTVIINPGSGPVPNATEDNAVDNMRHFVTDCKQDGLQFVRIPNADYGEGRFAFLIWRNTRCHEIQMPGLGLDRVRYTGSEEQNIWHFPRLYVNGSSYVWKWALLAEDSDWTEPEA